MLLHSMILENASALDNRDPEVAPTAGGRFHRRYRSCLVFQSEEVIN
jgi:hypothetical protein